MNMQQLHLQTQDKYYQNEGFTLIEVLLAIFLFLVGLTSFLLLLSNYFISFKNVKDRMIANLLAQEGLELVIAKRNLNISENKNWLNGLANSNEKSVIICLDYTLNVYPDCKLYFSKNYLSHNIGIPTIFTRKIILNSLDDNSLQNSNNVKVTSIVEWQNGSIELSTIITKWHPDIQ